MTIKTLENQRPHFPPELRCRIAEMVSRGYVVDEERLSSSVLEEFLPRLKFISEGLDLFFKASEADRQFHQATALISDAISYVRTLKKLEEPDSDPELKINIQGLNVLRSGFADQLYRKGPLIEEVSCAVKTLYMDLPDIVKSSRDFGSAVIHPVLDQDPELLTETYGNLRNIVGFTFHRQFNSHCHQMRNIPETATLIPDEDTTLIPTGASEVCWPNGYQQFNPLADLREYLPDAILEGVSQVHEQFLSLVFIRIKDDEVKRLHRQTLPVLRAAWDRVVEQVRLLLFLTDLHLTIQESALAVNWRYLFLQLEKNDDTGLSTVIVSKLKPLFVENEDNG